MAVTISGSVGAGGRNNMADVFAIQNLLNKWITPPITVNGTCDGKETDPTVIAIKTFQSRFSSRPDGRVDPGGGTLRRLNQEPLVQLARDPNASGYYCYSASSRQWGTQATLDTLADIGRQFLLNNPNSLMAVGDISFEFGGNMPPHGSHREGKHVDLRPMRTDNARSPVTYTDPSYDQANTKILIELFLSHRNVKSILFNDPVIYALERVSYWDGHHNHFHVTMHS